MSCYGGDPSTRLRLAQDDNITFALVFLLHDISVNHTYIPSGKPEMEQIYKIHKIGKIFIQLIIA